MQSSYSNPNTDNSFRDPSGFVFHRYGRLTRLVRSSYKEHYDHLLNSGLNTELCAAGLLVEQNEVPAEDSDRQQLGDIYRLLQPQLIPMISYPYEWCFSQLRQAALATLQIQELALRRNMTLKDAPAHNIQFIGGRPLLLDTLSFEIYRPGAPWQAYRQFCQHFLAPLLLLRQDYRLNELQLFEVDGIPLDLAADMLPWHSWFSSGALLHIHLHARAQRRFNQTTKSATTARTMSSNALFGLIDHLKSTISALHWPHPATEWADYYANTNYSPVALDAKAEFVKQCLSTLPPGMVWDFGANDGRFSKLAADLGHYTVSMDIDPVAVEHNYDQHRNNEKLLPLRIDLRNPSPGNGWNGRERLSLTDRGPADIGLALALIHHLAISNNVPLPKLASWFARHCRRLIIEFVPKDDSMVQRLLASRQDTFPDYDQAHFEEAFGDRFKIISSYRIPESSRHIYEMVRRPENHEFQPVDA